MEELERFHPNRVELDVSTPEEREKQIAERLISWKPYASRHNGQLVLFREKDKDDPRRWIWLNLHMSQMKGDAYFEEMMKEYKLTLLDMVGMLSALQQAGENIPPLPGHMLDGCLGAECGASASPGSSMPWTLGGDHTGPAPGHPPSPPSGGSGAGRPPPPSGPHRGGPTPGEVKKWEDDIQKKRDEQKRWVEEHVNGVPRGAPPAVPSPTDATYKPQWGEVKERYMCEGTVYFGYKNGCIDFQKMPEPTKWCIKSWIWLKRTIDKLDDAEWELQHHYLWGDGKEPSCSSRCSAVSAAYCYSSLATLLAVCGATPAGPACASALKTYPNLLDRGAFNVLVIACTYPAAMTCIKNQCGA